MFEDVEEFDQETSLPETSESKEMELPELYGSLVVDLVKAQTTLTEATATCQGAVNQINSSIKEAVEVYTKLGRDFDASVSQSMLSVVDKASQELMENLAENYKALHFQVEKWNRSGAMGGLYFMKYGIIAVIMLSLFNLTLLLLLIYRLK